MTIHVLIADDHEALRDGLRYMLTHGTNRFELCDEEATNGREAVALYRDLRPDVLLMDVKMPVMTGVQASVDILSRDPGANIVLFSAHDEPGTLTRALRAGCRGYVLKNSHASDVIKAIEMVNEGAMYIDPALSHELAAPSGASIPDMTAREIEVMTLLAQGHTTDGVAAKLVLSRETIRTHVRNSCRKLKADNKTHAVALAIMHGLIDIQA